MAKKLINSIKPGLVVLVTAGASGIGREIAETFLAHDCKVHVCDIDPAAIDDFLRANPGCSATLADVADVNMVDKLFDELVGLYGGLDVLVNNAGIAGPTAVVEDIDPADWDRTVAVDLNGQFYCCRRAVPLLKQAASSSIINISSCAAFFGVPLRAPYAACKWALIGFTKTLAMELGEAGVRVNAICPGSVSGDRIQAVIEKDAIKRGKTTDEIRDAYKRQSSLRCFVSAKDVAHMALFLVSDLGAHISGQALGVDGHTEFLSSVLD
jgi:NAD(P)-dependent dehydrogenase (short-subunit alcohol dehydrogenase family)